MIDPDGAVFLLRYDNEEVGVHWAMPGGGLDPGETPRDGARRELREETGWTGPEPGALLCTWEHDFTRAGVPVRQHEHIYLAYGPRRPPADHVSGVHAEEKILAWHWWTPHELSGSPEALWPPQLPELLTPLHDRGRSAGVPAPVHLGYVANPDPAGRSGAVGREPGTGSAAPASSWRAASGRPRCEAPTWNVSTR